MSPTQKGRFITFEGGEGSGKSTQARHLFDALNDADIPTIFTREPGGTDGAEEIRKLLVTGETARWDKLTETLLYFAARRDHLSRLIEPSLERGEWVICDRFSDSTMAYQGYGHGVSLELISALQKTVIGNFQPDLTFMLDIEHEVGKARTDARQAKKEQSASGKPAEDRYERMSEIFHKNVRRGFLEIAKNNAKRCHVIEAKRSIKDLHNTIVSQVNFYCQTKIKPLPLP